MGRVLVVDDDPSIRDMLRDVLTDDGHEVTTAGDGMEALEVLGKGGPFLVLLDLMMPRMDGLGVLRELENRPEIRGKSAVVVMSAADRLFALSAILSTGVVADQVAKPFELDVMLDLVNRLAPEVRAH